MEVEVNKISDTQQEIIQILQNSNNRRISEPWANGVIDYFVSSWSITNHEELKNLEEQDLTRF